MKLYRGDNIYNTTNPGIYRNNGIRSKAFGSGANPENIELQGLLQSIKKHIKPITEFDIKYYAVSDFISFSKCEVRAKYWCSDRGALVLTECENYSETRYMFVIDIEDNRLENLGGGIYYFKYKCNPLLKGYDENNLIFETMIKSAELNKKCSYCSGLESFHHLVLIDSYEYLMNYPKHEKIEEAIEFARRDKEYLLLPIDKIGKHRTTRIPRADFWSAKHFTVTGELRPKKDGL